MRRRDLPGWFSAEIDWLVNCSESEHGRRAVPLEPSMGAVPDNMDDLRCEAAGKARRITRALGCLTEGQRRLLLAAHAHVSPRQHVCAHDAHRRVCERVGELLEASARFRQAWLAIGVRLAGAA